MNNQNTSYLEGHQLKVIFLLFHVESNGNQDKNSSMYTGEQYVWISKIRGQKKNIRCKAGDEESRKVEKWKQRARWKETEDSGLRSEATNELCQLLILCECSPQAVGALGHSGGD